MHLFNKLCGGCFLALALTLSGSAQYHVDVDVKVDGEEVHFTHQQPMLDNSRVLIPLRGVFEKLGASVVWHAEDRMVTAVRGEQRVRLKIGSHTAEVNGVTHDLDVVPRVYNGRTLVPLRFVSEALQAGVEWKAEEKLVLVSSAGGDNLEPEPDDPRNTGETREGIVREAGPSIYMQGSHQLEDEQGNLIVLLSESADVDLDKYLGDSVLVRGRTEKTVEGNQTLMNVVEVERK